MTYQIAGINENPVIKVAQIVLNPDQLIDLINTPVTFIPAPQTNQVIVPISVVARTYDGSIPYFTGIQQSYDIILGYDTSSQVADFLTSLSIAQDNIQLNATLTTDAVAGFPIIVYANATLTQNGDKWLRIYMTYQVMDIS